MCLLGWLFLTQHSSLHLSMAVCGLYDVVWMCRSWFHHSLIQGTWLSLMCSAAKSCPTPYNPVDCSPPGSSVHGIAQVRILEWVAISSSRGSSWSRDWTHVSCFGNGFFTTEPSGIHAHMGTWTATCRFVCMFKLSFLWDQCLGVQFLGCMVGSCMFNFIRNCQLVFRVGVTFYIPINNVLVI